MPMGAKRGLRQCRGLAGGDSPRSRGRFLARLLPRRTYGFYRSGAVIWPCGSIKKLRLAKRPSVSVVFRAREPMRSQISRSAAWLRRAVSVFIVGFVAQYGVLVCAAGGDDVCHLGCGDKFCALICGLSDHCLRGGQVWQRGHPRC